MTRRAIALTLAVVVLLLAGCGPSSEAIISERRAEAEPKLKLVNEIGTLSLSYDKQPGAIALPSGEKLHFHEQRNAALLQTEKFAKGDDAKPSLDLIIDTVWLDGARELLADGGKGAHPDYVAGVFDDLNAIKYLVLVRTRMYAEPAVSNESQFSPGWWQADVMVFEIASGKCLGLSSIEATNSDEVNANLDEPDKWLHSDLWSHARAAVNEALAPHTEGDALN